MKIIKTINSQPGVYTCEVNITVEEWKNILQNENITTSNYREMLMAFYNEPEHKSTCKHLSLKYQGTVSDYQKYNSWNTAFGKAVTKYLNRFKIERSESEKQCYWNVAMNPGKELENGDFQFTLRAELVRAIEELGWNVCFSWIPFYMEFADKLLLFKDNRKDLIDIIYSLDEKYVRFIKISKDGKHVDDIDPFTVFAIFNRGISSEGRINIARFFKEKLNISASLPSEFSGIPIMLPKKSMFFNMETAKANIQPLWDFLEAAISGEKEELGKNIDIVRKLHGIKWNLTMALFWVRPYKYIALDSVNQSYLPKLGVDIFTEKEFNSQRYFILLDNVMRKLKNGSIKEKNIPEISYNAWQYNISGNYNEFQNIQSDEKVSKYNEYIRLLKANKNLVLTGAPGTGKTYMAQEIAKEMTDSDCIQFVQFHPSYDYTDFVEGLRPVDDGSGNIVFERKDGEFKSFCRRAIQNLTDSNKSLEVLGKESSWRDILQQFIEDATDNAEIFQLTNKNDFNIVGFTEKTITISNKNNEKTSKITINIDQILRLLNDDVELKNVRDIKQVFDRKHGTQQDSYIYVIVNHIRKDKAKYEVSSNDVEKIERKDFVFIIDEINRGETSKIFGELFYALDPDYRGKSDIRVQTQYQNLVSESDEFKKGFYVPENVYIIATMNDIDRSVESMDFAMRRRFIWKEVVPSDTAYMLDSLGELADEAKQRMESLNNAIAKTEGLGSAYMIGASYFQKIRNYNGDFDDLWCLNIEPLLKEYLRGFRKIDEIMNKFKSAYYIQKYFNTEDTPEAYED